MTISRSNLLRFTPVALYTILMLITARYLPVWTKQAAAALTWVVYARIVKWVMGLIALSTAAAVLIRWTGMRDRALFMSAACLWTAVAAWFIFRLSGSVNEYIHFPEYALLTLLWYHALARSTASNVAETASKKNTIIRAAIISGITGILEETSQLVIPLRRFDYQDILLNLMGVALGLLFLWVLTGERRCQPQKA